LSRGLLCAAFADGGSEDPEADALKGADLARQALQVAVTIRGILVNAALALADFGKDICAMLALSDRPFTLNPSFSHRLVHQRIAQKLCRPDIAIEHVEASLRLSPRAPTGWSHFN
jgi:hypothetical protein